MDLYTPEYAYDELQKYKSEIIKKSKFSPERFEEIDFGILSHIVIPIPESEYINLKKPLRLLQTLGI
ncbi:hypothetical protein TSIB_1938 [Thermococcus sibiricus MM 739]|uniref:PIN domain-containing protein n=1 Tax=Thermococcus sibiricus (strain DSM 12597 / MM 739) TaxID=604354 RepID=C6A006_THESM|nr:hypothetical protein TSIB_1938 [Thermococcus sibiricus MM 739]